MAITNVRNKSKTIKRTTINIILETRQNTKLHSLSRHFPTEKHSNAYFAITNKWKPKKTNKLRLQSRNSNNKRYKGLKNNLSKNGLRGSNNTKIRKRPNVKRTKQQYPCKPV
jgi:hypothetical protein